MPVEWVSLIPCIFALVFSSNRHFLHELMCGADHMCDSSIGETLPEHISWCTNHLDRCVGCKVSITCFAYLSSSTVREASIPGPWSSGPSRLKCCLTNPTALVGKTNVIAGMRANLAFLSETPSTDIVQKQMRREYQSCGYRSFWSGPVGKKNATIDNRPSQRGENAGTAIITTLPSRASRMELPAIIRDMCRINMCVW